MMVLVTRKVWGLKVWVAAFAFVVVLPLFAAPATAQAGRDDDDGRRSEFTGIIQERPERSLQGKWVIGGRAFTTDGGTEFDQSEGTLTVGSCAKVEVRNGRVHEIDSEPMRDCQ